MFIAFYLSIILGVIILGIVANRVKPSLQKTQQSNRWKPEPGDHYWYVCHTGEVDIAMWDTDDRTDIERREVGNCFPVRGQAEYAAMLIKEAYKKAHHTKES